MSTKPNLTEEKPQTKTMLIEKHRLHTQDTGSCEVQVALYTSRIKHLTEHLRSNPKDFSCRRGLIALTNQRRRQLRYLKRLSNDRFLTLTEKLGIRRSGL